MDNFGNSWVATSSATFAISPGAGGSISANAYTSNNAGTWTVTATSLGLIGTASLAVTHSSPVQISIGPVSASIVAGQTQSFKTTASDACGNVWDVTSATIWSIDFGAGGSWSGNGYTSNNAGTWKVAGTCMGESSVATIKVAHAAAVSLTVGPTSVSIMSGSQQAFYSMASDSYDNTWDVTNSTVWTIDAGACGSWSNNIYTSALSGIWNVMGSFNGLSNSVFLAVNHGVATSIDITPYNASIAAGTNEAYTVTAFDGSGNSWDVTNSATLSIASAAGGAWVQNVYTAARAGTWTITATAANLQVTSVLDVYHSSASNIAISTNQQTVTSGSTSTFIATAYDSSGNSWDVTNIVSWGVDANAYGSWSDNGYTSAKAGVWNVTASMDDFSNTMILNVTHGSAASITLTPQSSVVLTGQSQTFVVFASDLYGNSWDVTGSATWSIDSGAGGSWSSSTYTSPNAGNWTVTATYSDMQSEAILTVNAPASSPASPLPVATAAPLVATASPPATTPSPSQSPSPTLTAKPTADTTKTIRPTSIGNSFIVSPGTTVLSLLVLVIAIFTVITVAIIDVQKRKKSK